MKETESQNIRPGRKRMIVGRLNKFYNHSKRLGVLN